MKPKLSVAWFCASDRLAEVWSFGGPSAEDAIREGRSLFERDFWIAPGHPTTPAEEADGQELDYTVDIDHAQPIRLKTF